MKKYRVVTVSLMAFMAIAILASAVPLTSADPWSPGHGPPIVVDGDIGDWEPIKPLNEDPLGDTEAWSTNGTTNNAALLANVNWTWPYWQDFPWSLLWEGTGPGPGNITEADKCRDLKALYMWFDDPDWIYIRLDVNNLYPGWGWLEHHSSWYMITFSTDITPYAGQAYDSPWAGLYFDPVCAWEYALLIDEYWDGTYMVNEYFSIVADNWDLLNIQGPACDYANNAIELAIPRSVLEVAAGPLGVVSISVTSYKPGVFGNTSLGETATDHTFDPQAVINGISPPYAGEEYYQPACNGSDHADVMAPTLIWWAPGEYYGYVYHQKLVDMSLGAKIHMIDEATGQQYINEIYSPGDTFTVDMDIVDAINMTSIIFDLTGVSTALSLSSTHLPFGGGTFLGDISDWLVAPFGTAGYNFTYIGAGTGPSGNGTIIQYTFTVTGGGGSSSWICPEISHLDYEIGGERISVEIPVKNARFVAAQPPTPPPAGGEGNPIVMPTSNPEPLISLISLLAIIIPLVATVVFMTLKKKKQ